MGRKKTKKTRTEKVGFVAPRDEDTRAKLRAKADRAWPHPARTRVTYYPVRHRTGVFDGAPLHTTTRTKSFISGSGDIVVFLDGKAGYVLTSHLVLRPMPVAEPHWSETDVED